ncbi:alpha/beta fold hydrolase [Streptomyces sp. NPDC001661]
MLCDTSLWSDVDFPDNHEVRHVSLASPDIGALADDALASVQGPFVLVGLSLGAIVAFEMLRRAPERVAGVCVMSTNAAAPRPEQYAAWRELDRLIEADRFDEAVERTLPGMFDTPRPRTAAAQRYSDMAHRVGPQNARAQLAAQATRTDAFDVLRGVTCPATVLCGEKDALCPPEFHQAIADAIPACEIRRVPGAGHLLPWQCPGEVASAIQDLVGASALARSSSTGANSFYAPTCSARAARSDARVTRSFQ